MQTVLSTVACKHLIPDHTNGLEGAYTGFHAGAKQCFKLFLVLKPTLWKTKGVFNLLLTTSP